MISNQYKPIVGPLLHGYLKLLTDYDYILCSFEVDIDDEDNDDEDDDDDDDDEEEEEEDDDDDKLLSISI